MYLCVGIDPSTRSTGWAMYGSQGRIVKPRLIDWGVCAWDKDASSSYVARALGTAAFLAKRLPDVLTHVPHSIWIEDQYIGPNKETGLQLAHTAGIIAGYLYAQPCYPVPTLVQPKAWRKMLGFTARKTVDAKAEAIRFWAGVCTEHDAAEAACIARAAYEQGVGHECLAA